MTSVSPPSLSFSSSTMRHKERAEELEDGRSSDLLVTTSVKAIQNFVWANNLTLERINFIYLYCYL